MMNLTKILIIDDDAAMRTTLTDLVQRAGSFETLEAEDGLKGLALAREHIPDLILLDIMMPGRTGYEVCAELRRDRRTREVPILVFSGASEAAASTQALESGADDFLPKPFAMGELQSKIRSILQLNRYKLLRVERERFRWLLDRSLEPLIVASATGGLVFANARARDVFGIPDVPGTDVVAAIEQHYRSDPPGALQELRARKFLPGPGFAVVQPESELVGARWFEVELQAAEAATGELLLKFTDRTGWVRRELETWSFQHMVFHKVRTPLNGLGNVLDLVAATPAVAGDQDASELLKVAQSSARRLEDALLGVLAYHDALFRARPPVSHPQLAASIGELVEQAAHEAGLPRVTLLSEHAQLPSRMAAMLRVVLLELCDNYAKFSQAPALGLSVQLAVEGGQLRVRLFAPGPVPTPEALSQLGRPYWQLQARFTGEIPGMGLGLATVRLLLRTHGGELQLGTDAARTGLVTTLSVPLQTETAAEAPASESAAV